MDIKKILISLGIESSNFGAAIGGEWIKTSVKIASYSPVDGEKIGEVIAASPNDYHHCIEAGLDAFSSWRMMPAPQRRSCKTILEALRQKKEALGTLVSYEMGKSFQEGLGKSKR